MSRTRGVCHAFFVLARGSPAKNAGEPACAFPIDDAQRARAGRGSALQAVDDDGGDLGLPQTRGVVESDAGGQHDDVGTLPRPQGAQGL